MSDKKSCRKKPLMQALPAAGLLDAAIEQASVVVLNFALRFIPLEIRDNLIRRVHQGLLSETLARHRQRMTGAGFDSCDVWFHCFNFASLIALK